MRGVQTGDILYHKLGGQELFVIEELDEEDESADDDTIECRYLDKNGVYQHEEFLVCELTKKPPVTVGGSGPGGCSGNCRCGNTGGGSGA